MIGIGEQDGPLASTGVAAEPAAEGRRDEIEPRRRRTAFRFSSALAAVVGLAVFGVGLGEIVFMWLSDATLLSLFDDLVPSDLEYRAQFNHVGVVAWGIVPPLVVQLRKPTRRVAPMLQALAVAGAVVVVMAISGALEIVDIVVLAVVGLLAWLHPCAAELLRRPHVDGLQVRVVVLGVLPWLALTGFNVDEAWASRGVGGVVETSAQVLWANSALMPVVIVLAALVGSTDHRGWRLPAWTAALAAIEVGAHSLVFPSQAASVPGPWAVAAIAWGVAFAVVTVGRSRRSVAA